MLNAYDMPMVSGQATSGALSSKRTYPNFFRVTTPDPLKMEVLSKFLYHDLGIKSIVSIVLASVYTESLASALSLAADAVGMDYIGITHVNDANGLSIPTPKIADGQTVDMAKQVLEQVTTKGAATKTIVLCAVGGDAGYILEEARKQGLMGNGYFWIISEPIGGNTQPYWDGVFSIAPDPNTPMQKKLEEKFLGPPQLKDQLYANNQLYNQKICGQDQDILCANSAWAPASVPDYLADWGCTSYAGTLYESIIFFALAFDYLIENNLANADASDLTSRKVYDALLEFKPGGNAYNTYSQCMSSETKMNFNMEQVFKLVFQFRLQSRM